MFRLHIDIPLALDLEESKKITEQIEVIIREEFGINGIASVQMRLSNDLDRGNKNYLIINENGHCANKKSVIVPNVK